MLLESTGSMNIADYPVLGPVVGGDIVVTRLDGTDWTEDRYQVGQIIQLEGESYTRTILAIVDATILAPDDSQMSWGDNSSLVLSAPNKRVSQPEATVLAFGDYIADEDSPADNALALHVAEPKLITATEVMNVATSSLTRSAGNWLTDGFYVGQKVYISGYAGPFTIGALNATVMTLQNVALTPINGVDLTVFGYDTTLDGGKRVGGDHIVVTGGAGPNSPLVIYGDTSQDGVWYSGHAHDVLGMEFGEKPFDPFPQLTDGENEDDEWVFPLANPYKLAGNDVIDASALFASAPAGSLPSVGFTAYGGAGNDTIYGSQAGDHLAGGSGDDLIIGNRGVDHIYGDSGVNVSVFTRALSFDTIDASPLPSADPNTKTNGTTIQPVKSKLRDRMDAGRDVIFGDGASHLGYGPSSVASDGVLGDFDDIIFGDHGVIDMFVDDPNLPDFIPGMLQRIQTTELRFVLAIESAQLQKGDDDVVFGGLDRDVIVGGAGHDMLDGDQQDDRIFGDNVYLTRMGGADGNIYDDRQSLRFQSLVGPLIYSRSDVPGQIPLGETSVHELNSGLLMVNGLAKNYRDPDGAPWWSEYQVDYATLHTFAFDEGTQGVDSFGNDYIAGSQGHDEIFGQLGDDVIQGDGGIELAFAATSHVGASRTSGGVTDPVGPLTVVASFEATTDGEDYVEGGGGNDQIFGGLGQDDLIGGSSSFFSLIAPNLRPDGDYYLFGGAGTQIDRNNGFDPLANTDGDSQDFGEDVVMTVGTTFNSKHSRDSDAIAADNANIVRIVGTNNSDVNPTGNLAQPQYVQFTYDNYDPSAKIVVRGVALLDYTPGGPDFKPDDFSLVDPATTPTTADDDMRPMFGLNGNTTGGIWARFDIGGNDEVHGETGDDFVYVAGGFDIAFGDADDDDVIGGWGHDWISGGTGQDGVLGDDGRIFTSRNSTTGEALYGVAGLLASDPDTRTSQGDVLNELITTPGNVQVELINVAGKLKKSVDLTPFNLTAAELGAADPFLSNQLFADDVIFGGLGSDFLHGGSGDDAISGAEALGESYAPRFDSLGNLVGLVRTDFSRPYNPSDILHFGDGDPHWNEPKPVQSKTGEFFLYNEYDPRRVILFAADGSGAVWNGPVDADGTLPTINEDGITGSVQGGLLQYFLNWRSDEGESVLGYVAFKPDGQTPDPTVPPQFRQGDGSDVIFGDLGNDWIVGGTGRDHIYGGFGNDLMNADDVLGTVNPDPPQNNPGQLPLRGTDESPDTHLTYEDRVFGGAGLDILIGNTKGDRLIDWVGEFNSYIVPFAPFGVATVSRQVPPHLFDFLYAQAFGDGGDVTRTADTGTFNGSDKYSHVSMLQGGIDGEMGLVTQKDHGYWQDQTGGPTDPQPGNVPGGRRDVLRTADFNNGTASSFAVDEGNWSISGGKLSGTPVSTTQQAANVFYLDDYLPVYYEVTAKVSAEKPTGGWKSNAYVIFDYYSPTDFKFAGINVSNNKIEMGIRDASGWHIVKASTAPVQLKGGTLYDLLLAVNGNTVTLSVAGVNAFSYTYAARIVDGTPVFLNRGMVGLGTNGSKTSFDNFGVQILPPALTLDYTATFDTNAGIYLDPAASTGAWTVTGGRYQGTVGSGQTGLSLADLGTALRADAYLELEAKVRSNSIGGIVFDRYADDQFKFVALDVVNDKVLIGHMDSRGGWKIDQQFSRVLDAGVDYTLKLTLHGASVSVQVNGAIVGSYGFNSAVVDGSVGLLTRNSTSSFDNFKIRTNDPAFTAAAPLVAAAGPGSAVSVEAIDVSDVEPLLSAAREDWAQSGLATNEQLAMAKGVKIEIIDLPGSLLGEVEGNTMYLDVDAAGYGWFVDLSPANDNEFARDAAGNLVATAGGPAVGRIDLLSVVLHELGHVMGFDHADGSEGYVLSPILDAGERLAFDVKDTAPAAPRTTHAETHVFVEHLGAFVPAPLARLVNQHGPLAAMNPSAPEFVAIEPPDFRAANDEGTDASSLIDWSARANKLKYGRR
jgi:Ca2+-binding RTX toxin-like protein